MQFDRPLELEEPDVRQLMSHLGRRQIAYERFSRSPRGGSYQARVLLESMRSMVRALQLTVPFRTGSYQLENYLKAQLRTLADSVRDMPALEVTIEGHTDVRGARRFNRKLGLQRAQAVRAELLGAGVAANQVVARAYGVEGATYLNGDRGGYPFDRKVTIMFDLGEVVSWDSDDH